MKITLDITSGIRYYDYSEKSNREERFEMTMVLGGIAEMIEVSAAAKWETINCVEGKIAIVKTDSGFLLRDPNGMLVSGFFEETFEQAVRLMESCFTFTVMK